MSSKNTNGTLSPDAIANNATGPMKITGDEGSVQQHPLPDQIAADRYLRARAASKNKGLGGIKFTKLIPPGAE